MKCIVYIYLIIELKVNNLACISWNEKMIFWNNYSSVHMWFISDCHVVNISCIEKKIKKKKSILYTVIHDYSLSQSISCILWKVNNWASIKKLLEIKEKPRENLVECLSDTIRGIT